MNGLMRYAWLIISVSGLVGLAFLMYSGDRSSLVYVNVAMLVLTLAVLTRYAYDTHRIANANEEHFRYQLTPVLTVSVDPRLYHPAGGTDVNPTTRFLVRNDSRYPLELRVRIVVQFGMHKAVHSDRYYSGNTIWNIGPNENSSGNFKIKPFFKDIGDNAESMMGKLKDPTKRLKIYIFSEYRIYENNDGTFTENMPRTFWLKAKDIPPDLSRSEMEMNPLGFVWVYEFEPPPEEIKQTANGVL